MHVLIEYSRLGDGWRVLGGEDRRRYVEEVGRQLAPFFARGLRVLASGFKDPATTHPADYDFFAVYAAPDRAVIADLERAIERAGWYDLVEQVNMAGEALPLDAYLARLVDPGASIAPTPR
jgi:hypothetical protein